MRIVCLVALALCASVIPAQAQKVGTAPGWSYRHDRAVVPQGTVTDPRDTAWTFVRMPPGWHVTTGPGTVLFDPALEASGEFSLASQVYLFPNPTDEGYGIFLGGSAIESDTSSYVAVLLRRDGAVSIQSWRAGEATIVAPWTRHAAIVANPGGNIIENRLRVRAGADSLRVFVNDSSVLVIPRGALRVEGQVGLRAGRGINLHVTTFDHTRHLAPVR